MKIHITNPTIKSHYNKTIVIPYCDAQYLLRFQTPLYYNAGLYGWNFDGYHIDHNTIIVTGYRNMYGITPDRELLKGYEQKAKNVLETVRNYEDKRDIVNMYLAEFIKEVLK